MWVWIPRYEYKIDSTAKTIDVNFIEGTSTNTTAGYTLHPAFSTDIDNGGWSSDIAGFWVAKYPAGWQNGTDGEASIGTPERSSKTYQTTSANNTYDGNISTGKQMSYPVFKANTYAYNYITVGDAYTLSQDIKNASRYGLRNVDSHLQKNSEWGAVAYLAHSKYGVNGQDLIQPNDTNKNNTPTGIYAVTSPETVINTSTTQNITGVYDMSGCIWERTATFLKEGTTNYTTEMPIGSSNKYVTIYEGTWDTCNKKGDAVKETLTSGNSNNGSWNGDYSQFVNMSNPVFVRGGRFRPREWCWYLCV
ncbi:MAG: hypothetical protein HFJ23_01870 [Clostridia bacterium]|nr:hypothetical protein [Clostridia bacterium]